MNIRCRKLWCGFGLTILVEALYPFQLYGAVMDDGVVRCFWWVDFKRIPARPSQEITCSEALNRKVHYEITYDAQGKAKILQQYADGKLRIRHEYLYDEKGKVSSVVVVNLDGKRSTVLLK